VVAFDAVLFSTRDSSHGRTELVRSILSIQTCRSMAGVAFLGP
jgi:hypothetical protein